HLVISHPEWCSRLAQESLVTQAIQSAIRIPPRAIISFFSSWATTSIESLMLHKNQKLAEAKLPSERVSLRWNALVEDLRFFASVALAQLIVWRTLRRRYREASARRKAFK